ncbi:MAG: TetR/AcrR family transcriptional regulator [Firmicutes bacterium HGW-Firmicutes-11]|jgi:AcrR family transcriptional regulator|nr:MAG: TetR/AcrR family transcriptional regulator [Firmicutes bacterium HGW-Firmicutes-11]
MEDKKLRLYRCGKELFSEKGFKDTNVADITKLAGVSVGTYYNYYASKEKLFMEIYLEENAKLKQSMIDSVNPKDDPISLVKQMMALNLAGMKANPILRHWYNRDVFSKIEQLYREENGIEAVDFLYGDTIKMVEVWQSEGQIRNDIKSDMVMAIFSAIINLDTHKDEIGLQFFPEIIDYITEFIMNGLTNYKQTGA